MELRLMLGDRAVGTVGVETGARLEISCVCPIEEGYIYRPELRFADGPVVLGVMLPRGGRFVLHRTLARTDAPLEARILRALPGEQPQPPLPIPFSRLVPHEAAALVRDELLLRCCPERVAAAREPDGIWLAVPFSPAQESAFAPFFCVASLLERAGAQWLIFRLDAGGCPVPPPDCDGFCAAPPL